MKKKADVCRGNLKGVLAGIILLLPVTVLGVDDGSQRGGTTLLGSAAMMEDVRKIGKRDDMVREYMGDMPSAEEPASTPTVDPAEWRMPLPPAPQTQRTPAKAPFGSGGGAGYRDGKRDPFAPTDRLLQASTSGGAAVFQPLQQAATIPIMHLRGLVQDKDGTQVALLEIEKGGVHIVREGDTVGLYEMGANTVIRVRKINRLNLVVEAGSLGQLIIVR